jgi:hypothetical protein
MNEFCGTLLASDDMARGVIGDRKLCVPMLPSETIRIETAKLMAGKSDKTISKWCQQDGIGRQSSRGRGAHLQISAPALLMRAEGELEILERLRNGERKHPHVVHYIRKSIVWLEEVRNNASAAIPSRQ